MENLEEVLVGLMLIFSVFLLGMSLLSYRVTGNRKMLFVTGAFVLFVVKAIQHHAGHLVAIPGHLPQAGVKEAALGPARIVLRCWFHIAPVVAARLPHRLPDVRDMLPFDRPYL